MGNIFIFDISRIISNSGSFGARFWKSPRSKVRQETTHLGVEVSVPCVLLSDIFFTSTVSRSHRGPTFGARVQNSHWAKRTKKLGLGVTFGCIWVTFFLKVYKIILIDFGNLFYYGHWCTFWRSVCTSFHFWTFWDSVINMNVYWVRSTSDRKSVV